MEPVFIVRTGKAICTQAASLFFSEFEMVNQEKHQESNRGKKGPDHIAVRRGAQLKQTVGRKLVADSGSGKEKGKGYQGENQRADPPAL